MRRVIVGGLLIALLLASCSSSDDSSSKDTTTSASSSTSTTAAGAATSSAGVYVVQEAGATTLSDPNSEGVATLTMTDAQPYSVYFTGATAPRAGTAPNQDVIDVLYQGDAHHDAALSWSSDTDQGTSVVTILSGAYDTTAGTLTYQVKPIDPSESTSKVVAAKASASIADMQAGGKADTKPGEGATVPDDVTSASLFIDPVGQDQAEANCNLTIVNNTPWEGTVIKINKSDSGGMVDWDQPFTDNQTVAAGKSISAHSGNSAWDCHATVGIGFTPGSFYGVYVTLRDPVFSSTTWSCASAPEVSCNIEANKSGQPLNMTVTLGA